MLWQRAGALEFGAPAGPRQIQPPLRNFNGNIMRTLLTFALVCLAAHRVHAADFAAVAGTEKTVPLRTVKGRALLDADKAARAYGWTWKIVAPRKFGTFCNDAGCVPLSLSKTASATINGRLFLDAHAVGRALGFRAVKEGNAILLKPEKIAPDDDLPAYNAAWGKGRGFRPGQTLPDIPLTDVKGNEVRFSAFLGKKYIIYCWASW